MNIDPNFKLSEEIKREKNHDNAWFWTYNSIQKRMFYKFPNVDNLVTVGVFKLKPVEINGDTIISIDTMGTCKTSKGNKEVIDCLRIDVLINILEQIEEG